MSPITHLARPAYVLVVDDTPANITLLAEALSPQYRVRFATSGPRALELIARNDELPDLILLDVMMPEMDGYEVCRQLKEDAATRDIPVIFVSARNEVSSQEHGFNVGGVDYITTPFDLPLVRARVRTHVNLKRRTDLLEQLANLDGLTGIANRRRFDEVLDLEWRRATRTESPLSVVLLDVDHFKLYNDHYGHGLGDDCLRQVAAALAEALPRGGDLAARYGGEEFAAILPACDVDGAVAVAERIRAAIEQRRIPHATSKTAAFVTISAGCAGLQPLFENRHIELLEAADRALYEAKRAGRNQVCST